MTAAATFALDPVTVAFRAWLAAAVLTGAPGEALFPVGDSAAPLGTDGQPVPPPCGLVYQLPGQRLVPPYAGAVDVTGRWQVTTVGETASQAREWADRVRAAVAGEDSDGLYAHAMVLPDTGVLVLRRGTLDDGTIDFAGGLWSWSETFELDLSPA